MSYFSDDWCTFEKKILLDNETSMFKHICFRKHLEENSKGKKYFLVQPSDIES